MSATTERATVADRPRRLTLWWLAPPVLAGVVAVVLSVPLPPVVLGAVAVLWLIENRRTAAPMSAVRRERP